MNNNDLKITWLGHSCFTCEYDNVRIMFDPFKPGSVPGLKANYTMGVNRVFISHHHDDHDFDGVPCFLNLVDIPFNTYEVAHDEQNGALRGMNLIHEVFLNGYRIVHMGDIGCDLDDKIIAKLKNCDLLLIPINGFYTIGALKALQITAKINPKVMIPMHYYYNNTGYPDDHEIEKLLENGQNITKLANKTFNLKDYMDYNNHILVLDYKN